MTVLVTVNSARLQVSGLDHLQLTDLYFDAPEPPRDEAYARNFGLRPSSANILYVFDKHPTAAWHDPQNRLTEARAYRYLARIRATEPGEYERNFPFKTTPDDYQLKLFTHARTMTCIALAPVALGTGKTKMTLDIAADKFLRDEIDILIVIAPNGVQRQWINSAIPAHLSDSVPRSCYVWKPERRVPNEVARAPHQRKLRVIAFNVEAFSSESAKALRAVQALCATGRAMIVIDESTRIKNYKAIRTKVIWKLRTCSVVRVILTGTPVTKGLEDFFAQYYFLDPNIVGLSNYFAFRARYCIVQPAYRGAATGAVRIAGYKNQEELIRKIAPVSFMIGPEVLGLPPQRFERIEVEMTPEQSAIYRVVKDQLVEDLRTLKIRAAPIAMARIVRLQQILSGRYIEEEFDDETEMLTRTVQYVPTNRLERLGQALEQVDGQALVWCRFTDDIDDVAGFISGIGRVGVYDGRTKAKDRDEQVRAFGQGDLDYMILNPGAGSTGLDGLQCASTAFYYSHGYNYEHRKQSEGRIYRRGQLHSTYYGSLCVPGTVDTLILNNMEEKANLGRMIIEHPVMLNGGLE